MERGPQVIRQGVTDVRALVQFLREEGDEPIGIVGFSMGGVSLAVGSLLWNHWTSPFSRSRRWSWLPSCMKRTWDRSCV